MNRSVRDDTKRLALIALEALRFDRVLRHVVVARRSALAWHRYFIRGVKGWNQQRQAEYDPERDCNYDRVLFRDFDMSNSIQNVRRRHDSYGHAI
jgi:hypothetical protein